MKKSFHPSSIAFPAALLAAISIAIVGCGKRSSVQVLSESQSETEEADDPAVDFETFAADPIMQAPNRYVEGELLATGYYGSERKASRWNGLSFETFGVSAKASHEISYHYSPTARSIVPVIVGIAYGTRAKLTQKGGLVQFAPNTFATFLVLTDRKGGLWVLRQKWSGNRDSVQCGGISFGKKWAQKWGWSLPSDGFTLALISDVPPVKSAQAIEKQCREFREIFKD